MLDQIIAFSIRKKWLIGCLLIAWIGWGLHSISQLPIDAIPDITNNQVQIITRAPALAGADVERLITFPIEQEMRNIPQLTEMRSISRFGLSVITLVFNDHTDIYWARQQVQERLTQVEIMPEIGKPCLAPLSTGLGEVYQYVLRPQPGYEKIYDPMQLRELQDWVVRRQLLGIAGVADVSSFGGYLRQYEIAIDPERLRAAKLTLTDIARQLEINNQNTGAAYIEKAGRVYFIRSEGLIQSLDDIKKICVGYTQNGQPIWLENVAQVRWGHAIRYGALVYDDNIEAVGGIVLMLKGENASRVVRAVHERIEQIQQSLPQGVVIEPYLDRTRLVERAIHTILQNLTEGALVVIAVVVLLMGSWRAGIIIASVIPLAMLFAIAMMNLMGISGNLMSLGAIDFGIIVDGSIIVVEACLHRFHTDYLGKSLTQSEIDEIVLHSSLKVRKAAAFGESIIMLVYLPILVLSGVEGRLFKPMAMTVVFAIAGAFILSLTYVPMMTSLLAARRPRAGWRLSENIIHHLQKAYLPALKWAIRRRIWLVMIALLLFAVSVWRFVHMGAELVPTLQEGDIAIQVTLLQGSSLEESIRQTQAISSILLNEFPEVRATVGKVGTAEIPTDPMPVEETDLMVLLHERSQWQRFHTQQELAEAIRQRLSAIPGLQLSFQQPIQLRFNELLTGSRQDVVVKLYGEDFDTLSHYAKQIAQMIEPLDGVADVYIQRLEGMPQLIVQYDRSSMARYGISISEANQCLQAAFAGWQVGQVFEGERRFDLVVRYEPHFRQQIQQVEQLYVRAKDNQLVPLTQFARVSLQESLNEIRRDNGQRYIGIAFNIHGKDMESVVQSVDHQLKALKLPTGYLIHIGGQFENLRAAQQRLSVAVPIALAVILFLLFITFGSLSDALLIFMAVPFAAIGGIWALSLRGMPFSISAGVGFIALSGIAVLNGIVMVAEFRHIQKSGHQGLWYVLLKGATTRLRPVLTTAMVASVGFLPMALSQSDGAEVQRPLATVVIGGLISSSFLTLILLPCLYAIKQYQPLLAKHYILPTLLGVVAVLSIRPDAHAQKLDRSALVQLIETQQPLLKQKRMETEARQWEQKAWLQTPRLQAEWMSGQYNSVFWDNYFAVRQTIPMPWQWQLNRQILSHQTQIAEAEYQRTQLQLLYQAISLYERILYTQQRQQSLQAAEQIYEELLQVAIKQQESGEISSLTWSILQTDYARYRQMSIRNQLSLSESRHALAGLLGAYPDTLTSPFTAWHLPEWQATPTLHPELQLAAYQHRLAQSQLIQRRREFLPGIGIGYFNQSLQGWQGSKDDERFFDARYRFQGILLSVDFPIFYNGWLKQTHAQRARTIAAQYNLDWVEQQWQSQIQKSYQAIQTSLKEWNALQQIYTQLHQQTQQQQLAYHRGAIGKADLLIFMLRMIDWELSYWEALYNYNQAIIDWHYFSGTLQEALQQEP